MDLFATVKSAVTVKEAARHYGLKVGRNDMACCPFHDDRHPSLKLNQGYFYCFGCGATGDVIELVARLFHLSAYEAARKLAADFGLDPDKPPAAAVCENASRPAVKAFRRDEAYCQRVLCDYLHVLEEWKVRYAPSSPEEEYDDRFVEACQMVNYVENLADILAVGELEDKSGAVAAERGDDFLSGSAPEMCEGGRGIWGNPGSSMT